MMDSKRAIRAAYYTALKGNITLGSYVVLALDRVKSDTPLPYIKLSTQTAVEGQRGKLECRTQDTTILIDIVVGYDGNRGGREDADVIADQCLQILAPDDDASLPILGDGTAFRIVQTIVESDYDIEEQLPPSKILIRRLIRFRNTIEQLT